VSATDPDVNGARPRRLTTQQDLCCKQSQHTNRTRTLSDQTPSQKMPHQCAGAEPRWRPGGHRRSVANRQPCTILPAAGPDHMCNGRVGRRCDLL